MPKMRVNGVEIDYEDQGIGSPLVLIHGFGGHKGTWDNVISDLSRDHRVITMSHRGIAGSSQPINGDYSIETMSEDLYLLLAALKVENPVLLGHSMGGTILLVYYFRHPEACGGLVLYGTVSDAWAVGGGAPWGPEVVKLVEQRGLRPYVEEILDFWLSPDAPPQMKKQLTNESLLTPDSVAAAIFTELPKHSMSHRLQEISVPTLVIVGSEDLRTPVSESERINRMIPDSWLKIVKGPYHYAHLERSKEFTRAVLAFMRVV